MERVTLLVSDLDGTLIGDAAALADFARWRLRAGSLVRLAYSSGRFFESIRESVDFHRLPNPDAVIAGVGTEIYDYQSGERLPKWPPVPEGWNPEVIAEVCSRLDDLEFQPIEFQSQYKVSFYARADDDILRRMRFQLANAGQSVSIVYSSHRDLDVLPVGVNKGTAAAFLARQWGIERPDVVAAGDSGNDLAMFEEGFAGIVVANAHAELRAIRRSNVFHASYGFAAGVLEGLHRIRPDLWRPALESID